MPTHAIACQELGSPGERGQLVSHAARAQVQGAGGRDDWEKEQGGKVVQRAWASRCAGMVNSGRVLARGTPWGGVSEGPVLRSKPWVQQPPTAPVEEAPMPAPWGVGVMPHPNQVVLEEHLALPRSAGLTM